MEEKIKLRSKLNQSLTYFGIYQIINIAILIGTSITNEMVAILPTIIDVAPSPDNCEDLSSFAQHTYNRSGECTYNILNRNVRNELGLSINEKEFTECQRWNFRITESNITLGIKWMLVCKRENYLVFLRTIYFVGLSIGAFAFGFLFDHFGRRYVYVRVIILQFVVVVCAFFLPSFCQYDSKYFGGCYTSFAIVRLLMGMTSSAITMASDIIVCEVVGIPFRLMTFVVIYCSETIGDFILSIISIYNSHWQKLTLIVSCFFIPNLLTIWYLAETPQWFLTREKVKNAKKEIHRMISLNRSRKFLKKEHDKKNVCHSEFLLTRKQFQRLFVIVVFSKFATIFIINGLQFNVSSTFYQRKIMLMFYGFSDLVGLIAAYFLIRKESIQLACFVGYLFTGIFCLLPYLLVLVDANHSTIYSSVVMIGRAGLSITILSINFGAVQMFPVKNRGKLLGLVRLIASFVGIVEPFIIQYINDYAPTFRNSLFAILSITSGIICLYIPKHDYHIVRKIESSIRTIN
ncbi:hypothetical protein SNEBB_009954 [Seison nebaliae]|nr:hypothetical protein SNEBB_009954 [Seison nebaliae]